MKLLMLWFLAFVSSVMATGPVPVHRSGLAGIDGFTFYNPYCGHGCFRSFSAYTLSCSNYVSAGGHTTDDDMAQHLAQCRSSNWPFLSSVAWCMHLYCPSSVAASTKEKFWETSLTGIVDIPPKWSYGEVLANITEPPTTVIMNAEDILNRTMITTADNFQDTTNTLIYYFRETAQESYYGLAILLTAFGIPIALTWLGYLPFMSGVMDYANPWLYRSIFGTYHDRPLPFLIGNAPTVGQGFYITIIFILNIVFLAVGYKTLYPNRVEQWYKNRYQELMAYFMWRTGVLAFCQMPVLFLFATRNNILLWMTNWSHSTYMLLHRWVARFFLLQTLLHSIISLVLYVNTGSYASSLKTLWWIWGCVATVAAVIIALTSLLVFRHRAYELFLATHIIMSVICVVGCWYHVWYGYENTFGYETWLYATIAVWFFDRLVRLGRIMKTGVRRANVTDLSASIARIDIPGIRWSAPGRCVYVYFPTLHPLRPWENHPFSLTPTALLNKHHYHYRDQTKSDGDSTTVEKAHPQTAAVAVPAEAFVDGKTFTNSGLTLFVRKKAGATGHLKAQQRLVTLVEGPYPTNPTKKVLHSDRLLLIGGGMGITGLLPFLSCHPNAKLFCSVKLEDQCLLDALKPVLEEVREKELRTGRRLDLEALLQDEAGLGWSKIAAVVCGPAPMCDRVRSIVARLGREKRGMVSFELEVDAFAW